MDTMGVTPQIMSRAVLDPLAAHIEKNMARPKETWRAYLLRVHVEGLRDPEKKTHASWTVRHTLSSGHTAGCLVHLRVQGTLPAVQIARNTHHLIELLCKCSLLGLVLSFAALHRPNASNPACWLLHHLYDAGIQMVSISQPEVLLRSELCTLMGDCWHRSMTCTGRLRRITVSHRCPAHTNAYCLSCAAAAPSVFRKCSDLPGSFSLTRALHSCTPNNNIQCLPPAALVHTNRK